MATGEYVSVSSQSDSEKADIDREKRHLAENPAFERRELAQIYKRRGLDAQLAQQVADQLMATDPLGAHVRDELGITGTHTARPLVAAGASALSFATGAFVPLSLVLLFQSQQLMPWLVSVTLVTLVALGMLSSRLGGAPVWKGGVRILFWGSLAMALTFWIGNLFQ